MNSEDLRTNQTREQQLPDDRDTGEKLDASEDPMINTRMVFERYLKD